MKLTADYCISGCLPPQMAYLMNIYSYLHAFMHWYNSNKTTKDAHAPVWWMVH